MIENTFQSVWDALEDTPAEAANMRARAELMVAIQSAVNGLDMTQGELAQQLGLTQPRVNDLLRGKIDKFSLDALVNIAFAAGLTVAWNVTRSAA